MLTETCTLLFSFHTSHSPYKLINGCNSCPCGVRITVDFIGLLQVVCLFVFLSTFRTVLAGLFFHSVMVNCSTKHPRQPIITSTECPVQSFLNVKCLLRGSEFYCSICLYCICQCFCEPHAFSTLKIASPQPGGVPCSCTFPFRTGLIDTEGGLLSEVNKAPDSSLMWSLQERRPIILYEVSTNESHCSIENSKFSLFHNIPLI